MGSRRLDIGSLLCTDDDGPRPIVLAPHLRNPDVSSPSPSSSSANPDPVPAPPAPRRPTLSDLPPDNHRPYPDPPHHRPPPPRSIDNLIHHQHPHRQQPDPAHPSSLPRPSSSSSSSLSARSPAGGYAYPPAHSPSHSPLTHLAGLPPLPPPPPPPLPLHPGYASPVQHRSSASPFYQPTQTSPLLHRPASSHSQVLPQTQPQPRHTYRSRSNTTSSASPTTSLYPLASPQIPNKMAFAGLEALVHAATEERKRLSAGGSTSDYPPPADHHPSPLLHHSHTRPPLQPRSPDDPYRPTQSITSPSLAHQREYPAVLPPSHASRHRPLSTDDPRLSDDYPPASPYPRPPRHKYDEDHRQQQLLVQERERELQFIEQRRLEEQIDHKRLEQQRIERQRVLEQWELRQREENHRQKRLQEQLQQEELERERLLEQQKLERQRLQEEQLLVERRKQERQREERRLQQQRLEEEEHLRELERRRQEDAQRHLEEKQRMEEELRLKQEALRRAEDERRSRAAEEQRQREEKHWIEDQRRREEQRRVEEQSKVHRQQEDQERQVRAERELQRQQQEIRPESHQADQRRSPPEGSHQHAPSTQHHYPVTSPTAIELPQPLRPFPLPRKADPVQIKRHANPEPPSPLQVIPPPLSPIADNRPTKKQRYSESPPPSSAEPIYPRIVALPPPISTDLPHRPGSSTVRRPGSGQGRKQLHGGLGDAVEREREKERERHLSDIHRIISPLGRRSPPGSQIGRAKAAKKSDDARRADEAATAAAIADLRKVEDIQQPQAGTTEEILRPMTSPVRAEAGKLSQERILTTSRNRDTLPPKLDESMARKSADDGLRKMSLDIVMSDEAGEPTVIKRESPQATSLESPPRLKGHSRKDTVTRLPRDDRGKSARSRSSDAGRIAADAQNLPQQSHEVGSKEMASAIQPPQQEDAHEWLLVHYAQSPTSQLPPEPPRSLSPSISPVLPIKPQVEQRKAQTPPPDVTGPRSVSPDADAALERELAELMAEEKEEEEEILVHKREPDDMDIDLAVAQTLDEGSEDLSVAVMEVDEATVDVEAELLSLVDDRPALPPPTGRKVATPNIPTHQPPPLSKLPTLKMDIDDSSHSSIPAPPVSAPSVIPPTAQPPSARSGSDREPMLLVSATPHTAKEKEEEAAKRTDLASTVSALTTKKKKDAGGKASAKGKTGNMANPPAATVSNKQQKAKAMATKKAAAKVSDTVTNSTTPTSTTSNAGTAKIAKSSAMANKKSVPINHATMSRSRSTSVIPAGSADAEVERKSEEKNEEEEDSAEVVDDKLYCVCKTKYDEDRFMIACDRCDEWYHTTCVNMPDLEVDLVDQFFCPPCIEQNGHLRLKTTYKQRCLNGLRHPDPDSPKACHKPARGAFSKYCSDECGVKYMQSRIDAWAKKGGKREELWESVKNAERREGVAVCVDEKVKSELEKKKQGKVDRETQRLRGLLDPVVKMREEIKSSMQVLVWRERLLQLASERAEHIDQCGWDQRLCFGDEEWQDFGAGVLESYDDIKAMKAESGGMQVDESEEEGEWWCPGLKSCKRHTGWQTLRYKDICKEREKKEDLLAKVTARERQLRKRVDDLTNPSGRKSNDSISQVPLKSSITKLSNGHTKLKGTTETLKKGKKRKAPAS